MFLQNLFVPVIKRQDSKYKLINVYVVTTGSNGRKVNDFTRRTIEEARDDTKKDSDEVKN